MVQLTYISPDGSQQTIDVEPGYSVMEGAIRNAIRGIDADCGGNCYCATCRVYVSDEWKDKIGEQSDYEVQLLDSIGDVDPAIRLSCQIKVTDALNGMVLRIPDAQK